MKAALLFLLASAPIWAQVNTGELRLKVIDPAGTALRASVELIATHNGYDRTFTTDAAGQAVVEAIPYGEYLVQVKRAGFAAYAQTVAIHSALPFEKTVQLGVAPVITEVNVKATGTLIDPSHASSAMLIGSGQIQERAASLPGRSVQDLVVSQPGWLYEGNAVLHPRGSEYQTQFVIDGIPLTDNRSPGFGPEIDADDLEGITIFTAGIPAEYGRKMGGVVELDTRRPTNPGLHGEFTADGGNYATASSFGDLMDMWGRNAAGVSAAASRTDHYLNPVVPQNYTNTGTGGDFAGRFERELTASDRLTLSVRHEFSRYLVPNEIVQEQAGQIQRGDNSETIVSARYQRILSPQSLMVLAGMVRDNADDLSSNASSTPILAFLHNHFREGYFKGTISLHRSHHEWKAGVESDSIFLHEQFSYTVSDPSYFDSSTPPSRAFVAQRPDLEQSAFVEDEIHAGNWTLSAGLRWDHYQLLLNRSALSPRISVGRYLPALNMTLHVSYDRVFQTPSFENILISSSAQIDALNSQFLRLPVEPSNGNYYEGGVTQSLLQRIRVDANVYRREMRNFADDDQLLNTGVSYPISFDKAIIYGAEGKLTIADLGKLSGYASYSYMVGNAWYPVTGGLFLGNDASAAVTQMSGHFPDSQDQRNTLATRLVYRLTSRLWATGGALYGSGLPFEIQATEAEALAEYGPAVVARVNFARGRVRPQFSAGTSLGFDLHENARFNLHLQADGENLMNRLNVIDFGGLFSGNAIGPRRTLVGGVTARF